MPALPPTVVRRRSHGPRPSTPPGGGASRTPAWLLHYSPTITTLHGEPPHIWPFLGAQALAEPIIDIGADLVVHGHAHNGGPDGRLVVVPVYNVALPANRDGVSRIEVTVQSTSHAISRSGRVAPRGSGLSAGRGAFANSKDDGR